jgi:hypothetical protein
MTYQLDLVWKKPDSKSTSRSRCDWFYDGVHIMETKTVLIGNNELSHQDLNAVSEMVHDALREMGIEPASFAWHIEVEYTEGN